MTGFLSSWTILLFAGFILVVEKHYFNSSGVVKLGSVYVYYNIIAQR